LDKAKAHYVKSSGLHVMRDRDEKKAGALGENGSTGRL
jgi:hypothetical protein